MKLSLDEIYRLMDENTDEYGNVNLDFLTEIPSEFCPEVDGDLSLNGLKSIPCDFHPTVEGYLLLNGLETIPNHFEHDATIVEMNGLKNLPSGFTINVVSNVHMDNVTEIPTGFNVRCDSDSCLLSLDGVKKIPKNFEIVFDGLLSLDGLENLPSGFSPNVQELHLDSVKELPSDFCPIVDGDLFVRSLYDFPKNFQGTVNGEVYFNGGSLSIVAENDWVMCIENPSIEKVIDVAKKDTLFVKSIKKMKNAGVDIYFDYRINTIFVFKNGIFWSSFSYADEETPDFKWLLDDVRNHRLSIDDAQKIFSEQYQKFDSFALDEVLGFWENKHLWKIYGAWGCIIDIVYLLSEWMDDWDDPSEAKDPQTFFRKKLHPKKWENVTSWIDGQQ